MCAHILVVEDDKEIREMLCAFLTQNGYQASQAVNGLEALRKMEQEKLSLVLLDIMLPYKSGDEVLRKLREQSELPVIVLSAKDTVQTKVDVMRMGADDYVTKPFDLNEVLVRIEAVLRRASGKQPNAKVLTHKNLQINRTEGRVYVKGEPVTLTSKEYAILELLLTYPEKLFSKSNLFEAVWEEDYLFDDNTLKVHVSNLRSKLKKYDEEEYIETIWGMGYRLAK